MVVANWPLPKEGMECGSNWREREAAKLEWRSSPWKLPRVTGGMGGTQGLRCPHSFHFASTTPGMGLIAHIPYMEPGKLPRLHICQSQAAPPLRRNGKEGRRWTGELFPHTSPLSPPAPGLPPLPPAFRAIWLRTICWAVGGSAIAL